jgi:hypothetical protein
VPQPIEVCKASETQLPLPRVDSAPHGIGNSQAKKKGPGLPGAFLLVEPSAGVAASRPPSGEESDDRYSSGTSSSATMLMILISGLMAGPAVSL